MKSTEPCIVALLLSTMEILGDYFDDNDQLTDILKDMANHLGTAPYTIQDLQAMNYYVMIEPIAIMRVALDGEKLTLALTATEGALYDKKIGDYIFSSKITFQHLHPLS